MPIALITTKNASGILRPQPQRLRPSHPLRLVFALALLLALLLTPFCQAHALDLSRPYNQAIGTAVSYFQEPGDTPLPVDSVLRHLQLGDFIPSNSAVLSFGIHARPVWLAFDVSNPLQYTARRHTSIETSWLDQVDFYFLRDGQLLASFHTGDSLPFSHRPTHQHFFTAEHDFAPGRTKVLIRVATPDPMVIPLYFLTSDQRQARDINTAYGYGLLYGIIFALLAYNFLLYLGTRLARHFYYSVYLACFIAMNVAYTGHGYQLFWPDSPRWQLWSNPVLMTAFALSALVFAMSFLNTRESLPRLHTGLVRACLVIVAMAMLAVALDNQHLALLTAFTLGPLYAILMVVIGLASLLAGNKSAWFFLLASVTAAIGACITTLAVWGQISFTDFSFHAVEFGMVFDAIFLAFALAHLFRITEEEKIQAEQMALTDPLTRLNNRRAFNDYAALIWNTATRHRSDVSVILLDIDHFKVINDTYGHPTGDKVLVQIARTLGREKRGGDILARWGGEEFILLLPETACAEASGIAERLRHEIAGLSITTSQGLLSLTASFGVTSSLHAEASLEALINRADKHLYQAKQRGRNRVASDLDEAAGCVRPMEL